MKRLAVLLVVASVFVGSCRTEGQKVGEMGHETRSIQPQNAQSVRTHLVMGAGKLNVSGGADALMDADFAYNVANWKPKVNYEVSRDEGELSLKQGSGKGVRIGGGARNEWDIRFNDEVPTDLVV